MKVLVYLGSAKKAVEERPRPEITSPTDAIVRIAKTTICGTDLRILKGDVPSCQPGRILGQRVSAWSRKPDQALRSLSREIRF